MHIDSANSHFFMSLSEIQVPVSGALLQQLSPGGLPLVSGALQVILLMVSDARGKKVIHHHNPNVHTAAL